MPVGKPTDPTVERIAIYPDERVLDAGQRPADRRHRHLHRRHDRRRDPLGPVPVERHRGRRGRRGRAGRDSAARRARRPSWRATRGRSPSSGPRSRSACRPRPTSSSRVENAIDAAALKQWKALGIVAVGALHRRRVHPPGVARHHRHPADGRRGQVVRRRRDPDKRAKLVDQLLDRPEYAVVLRDQVGRHPAEQARGPR